jgi:hypothetical protein
MNVTFVRCESFGCKNLTSDLYKKLYGSYCFEHCAKTNKPVGVLDKPKLISPISPRRTKPLDNNSKNTKSPGTTFENYEFKTPTVPSTKFSPVSPKRSVSYVPKTECCICKNPYDETKVMKCGHLICPECLEGRVRKPYCDFCGEPLDGPFVTPEVLVKIEDKYKYDLELGIENDFTTYDEDSYNKESYYEFGPDDNEDSNYQNVIEEHNMTGL